MGFIIGEQIPRVHSDASGNPSQSTNPGALAALLRAWNEFVHGPRRETTVTELAEILATERRVAASLYPPRRTA